MPRRTDRSASTGSDSGSESGSESGTDESRCSCSCCSDGCTCTTCESAYDTESDKSSRDSIAAPDPDPRGALRIQEVSAIVERLPHCGPRNGFTLALAAKRNSGKTRLMEAIITELLKRDRVDVVVAMSHSARLNHKDYARVLPPELIRVPDGAFLERIWNAQEAKELSERSRILVIFDDIAGDREAEHGKLAEYIHRIFTRGRHIGICAALLTQYPAHVLTPTLRANADILCWTRLSQQGLERVREGIAGVSSKDLDRITAATARGYAFVCYDNITERGDGETDQGKLFAVRAPAPSSPAAAADAKEERRGLARDAPEMPEEGDDASENSQA